jgi:hypothetical protein
VALFLAWKSGLNLVTQAVRKTVIILGIEDALRKIFRHVAGRRIAIS